jgi:hypothetical protein
MACLAGVGAANTCVAAHVAVTRRGEAAARSLSRCAATCVVISRPGAANTSLVFAYVARTVPADERSDVMMRVGAAFPVSEYNVM